MPRLDKERESVPTEEMPFDAVAYAAKQKAKKERAKQLRADRAARSGQLKREAEERAAKLRQSRSAIGIKGIVDTVSSRAPVVPALATPTHSSSYSKAPPAVPANANSTETRLLALESLVASLTKRMLDSEMESERLRIDATELRTCCKRQGKMIKRLRAQMQTETKHMPTVSTKHSTLPPEAVSAAEPVLAMPKDSVSHIARTATTVNCVAATVAEPPSSPPLPTMAAVAAPERKQPLSTVQPPKEFGEVTLCPCPTCGRKFREVVLVRHQRVCLKLQKKRPVLKTEFIDLKANGVENLPSRYGRNARRGRAKKQNKAPKSKKSSGWKEQSGALRAAMAGAREYAAEVAAAKTTSAAVRSSGGVAARSARRNKMAR